MSSCACACVFEGSIGGCNMVLIKLLFRNLFIQNVQQILL